MIWMQGISPCTDLGVNGCRVLWEAWAVVVAIAAAGISALSALAVFYLGSQANKLANSAHASAKEQADSAERRDAAARERQERVILSYLSAELDGVYNWANVVINLMAEGGVFSPALLMEDRTARVDFAELGNEVSVERLNQMLPSFHQCSPQIGMRLARLVGNFASVQASYTLVIAWDDASEHLLGHHRVPKSQWDAHYELAAKKISRIQADSKYCGDIAYAIIAGDPLDH